VDRRRKVFSICFRMFGESGASAKNCIWSATLTQRHGKPNCRQTYLLPPGQMQACLFHCARRARTVIMRAIDIDARQMLRVDHPALSILVAALIMHRTPHKAELSCEIRMM
jgi:hypothetical protein